MALCYGRELETGIIYFKWCDCINSKIETWIIIKEDEREDYYI